MADVLPNEDGVLDEDLLTDDDSDLPYLAPGEVTDLYYEAWKLDVLGMDNMWLGLSVAAIGLNNNSTGLVVLKLWRIGRHTHPESMLAQLAQTLAERGLHFCDSKGATNCGKLFLVVPLFDADTSATIRLAVKTFDCIATIIGQATLSGTWVKI